MTRILLVNPNTSAATTAMMVAVARRLLPAGIAVRGVGAARGPTMIVDEVALAAAAAEVVRVGMAEAKGVDAVVVAAFGDPGVASLRARLAIPVIGIGEASVREAGAGGRAFGVATTTSGLSRAIATMVQRLLPGGAFTGVRVPQGDPVLLAADPIRQAAALHGAVLACVERDGAQVVIIGGGPLTDAAAGLRQAFGSMIVEPVPAALRVVSHLLCRAPDHPRLGSQST